MSMFVSPAANDSSGGDSSGAVVGPADCDANLLQSVASFCKRHADLQVADPKTSRQLHTQYLESRYMYEWNVGISGKGRSWGFGQ